MNWEAIGAVGEVAGAFLVAITLIYLVIQVRQNSASINANITQANISAFNELNALLASNPALAEVFEKGVETPESLTEAEDRSYTWLMRSFLNLYLNLYDQYHQGTCTKELWERHALELAVIAPSPGIQAFRKIDTSFEGLFEHVEQMALPTEGVKLEHRLGS